jgi:molybdopterin synthase catalytic subunit
MRVTVRLFAGLRERAGWGRRELELAEGAVVAEVWGALGLGVEEPPGLLYAVDREYVRADRVLADGDEVALIPPVSGGSADDVRIVAAPVSLDEVARAVADDEAGAIATFTGTVRVRSRHRRVLYLEYEAYEDMALDLLARLAADLRGRHGLTGIAIHHRVGRVEIGEASVVIAASAPHRAEAFAACREAIETLKASIPLWKKEVYEGGEEWISRGS